MKKTLALAALALACTLPTFAADAEKSLYERLGGKEAISAVSDNFTERILADQRLAQWFNHAASTPEATRHYKTTFHDFLCKAVGGPCEYKGFDMVEVHKGRGITEEAFNVVVEDLLATFAQFKVPQAEQNEVLKMLGGLKPAIVEKK